MSERERAVAGVGNGSLSVGIDWYDTETRIALVRDFAWSCFEPSWECDICPAKPHCHWHEQEGGVDHAIT